MEYVEPEVRYKKKSSKKRPKKLTHKHQYEPCVFEFHGIVFDKAHGIVDNPEVSCGIGQYCPVCGKIGPWDAYGWSYRKMKSCPVRVDEELQLDPATRTLPTFKLDDVFFQKYVSLR